MFWTLWTFAHSRHCNDHITAFTTMSSCNNNDRISSNYTQHLQHVRPGHAQTRQSVLLSDSRPPLVTQSLKALRAHIGSLCFPLLFIYRIMNFGRYFTTRSHRRVLTFGPSNPLVQVLVQRSQFQHVIMELSPHSEPIKRSVGANRLPATRNESLKACSVTDLPQ
jgi:hypothetical protein